MGTKRQQVPVKRVDSSQPGPSRATAQPTLVERIGAGSRMLFPTIASVNRAADADAAARWAEGDTAGMLGVRARQTVQGVGGLVNDVVGRPLSYLGSEALSFLGGAAGFTGDDTKRAAAPKATAKPARAVAASAAVQPTITPQDRQLALIDTILRGPVTLREAQAATGMLPAPAKPQTAKDKLVGSTADLSQSMFSEQVAQARELAKTDPVGAREVVAKATDEYFKRQTAILGFDPGKLELAQMMADGGEE